MVRESLEEASSLSLPLTLAAHGEDDAIDRKLLGSNPRAGPAPRLQTDLQTVLNTVRLWPVRSSALFLFCSSPVAQLFLSALFLTPLGEFVCWCWSFVHWIRGEARGMVQPGLCCLALSSRSCFVAHMAVCACFQFVLALCTYIFSWTATLLCWSAETLPPDVIPSYPNIARSAMGVPGQVMARIIPTQEEFEFTLSEKIIFLNNQVSLAVLLEFWGALGMCLIVLWHSMLLMLPSLENHDMYCWEGSQFCLTPKSAFMTLTVLLCVTTSTLNRSSVPLQIYCNSC